MQNYKLNQLLTKHLALLSRPNKASFSAGVTGVKVNFKGLKCMDIFLERWKLQNLHPQSKIFLSDLQ